MSDQLMLSDGAAAFGDVQLRKMPLVAGVAFAQRCRRPPLDKAGLALPMSRVHNLRTRRRWRLEGRQAFRRDSPGTSRDDL
jgi:hypothetical protein